VPNLEDVPPRSISNITWSFASSGLRYHHHPQLFSALARAALAQVEAFSAQDLANTAWAMSTAEVAAPQLFSAFSAQAVLNMEAFNAQALANTAWAFATAGHTDETLFDALASRALDPVDKSTSDAFDDDYVHDFDGDDSVPDQASSGTMLSSFTDQAFANTAWAFATAGVDAPLLFDAMAAEVPKRLATFQPEALCQLHQVRLHLSFGHANGALCRVLDEHSARLRAAYLRHSAQPMQWQRDCSASLDRIDWPHEFEHVTSDGLSLDMAQPLEKFAVEFDGPWHYLTNLDGSRKRSGSSTFKDEVLRKLGWTVVHVPFYEWDEISRRPASATRPRR
jgi:hypothetical protein